jgi:hypothetical protein
MKSALANIGEREASRVADILENAGIEGNIELINANNEDFVEMLEALIENLAAVEAEAGDSVNTTEGTGYLTEELSVVKKACEDYDDTTAYAALDRLEERQWEPEIASLLDNFRHRLYLHSDFEDIAKDIGLFFENNFRGVV